MGKRSRNQKSNRSSNKFKPKTAQGKLGAAHNPTAIASDKAPGLPMVSAHPKDEGRLVWNHSTHLQGLIPKLKKLCKQPGVVTVTPAVLGRARSHAPKLMVKVSVPIRGGYKLIARNGKSFQEVFVITSLDKDGLESAIAQSLG